MASGKEGKRSRASSRHGREGWITWMRDNAMASAKSKMVREWIPIMVEQLDFDDTSMEELVLSAPDGFKSNVSELRSDPGSSWGYLVVPRISGIPSPLSKSVGKHQQNRVKIDPKDRKLRPGDPDLDRGASALICLEVDHSGTPIEDLDEKHDPYSRLLDDCGKLLATYDYVRVKNGYPATDVRNPKGKGASDNLRRKTIDVSPGISRAFQFMIEDGRVEEARALLDKLQPILAKEIEETFPLGKIVACAWHCNSGMPEKLGILHLDVWLHSTELRTEIIGSKKKSKLLRIWNAGGLDHGGPGPGICAWDRHMRALGNEMEVLAPGRCFEVRFSMEQKENRAISRKRPGTANRDVRLHRRFDDLVGDALPDDYLARGMSAYREHLLNVYAGGEPKFDAMIADPKAHDRKRARLVRAMLVIRSLRSFLSKGENRLSSAREKQVKSSADARREIGRKLVETKKQMRSKGRKIGKRLAQIKSMQRELDAKDQELFQNTEILDLNEQNLTGQLNDLKADRAALTQLEHKLRQEALFEGLLQARQLFFGKNAKTPNATSVKELAAEFKGELFEAADRKAIKILRIAHHQIAPRKADRPMATTLDEVVEQIETDIKVVRDSAVLAAWKKVFGILAPSEEVGERTPKEIEGAIRSSLVEKVGQGLKAIMAVLGKPGDEENITLENLEEQASDAANDFRRTVERDIVESVWERMELKDDWENDVKNITTSQIKELIEERSYALRDGAHAASDYARRGMLNAILGPAGITLKKDPLLNPVEMAKSKVRELKSIRDLTEQLVWHSEDLKAVNSDSDTGVLILRLRNLMPEPEEETIQVNKIRIVKDQENEKKEPDV